MELNKAHRQCLLEQLNKQERELENLNSILSRIDDVDSQDWNDIKIFLIIKNIELIKESIENNEIDY